MSRCIFEVEEDPNNLGKMYLRARNKKYLKNAWMNVESDDTIEEFAIVQSEERKALFRVTSGFI